MLCFTEGLFVLHMKDLISANAGVSCKKEKDSQASTIPIAFHLPFGYILDRYPVFKIVSQK